MLNAMSHGVLINVFRAHLVHIVMKEFVMIANLELGVMVKDHADCVNLVATLTLHKLRNANVVQPVMKILR